MSVEQFVDEIKKELIEGKQKNVHELEYKLSENVEELSKNENFFQCPLKNIFSIISKIHFNLIDESDDGFEILQNIIKGTINAHYDEKETLLLLQNIDFSQFSLSYEGIFSILELFTNCPIIREFCNLHIENQKLPDIDFEYELKQKDEEIEKLKHQSKGSQPQIQTIIHFPPISEKPKDFESDIFKALKSKKFTSIQWLIENENINNNIRNELDNSPIHVASEIGVLPLVQYFIEKQRVNINIKGFQNQTPLIFASQEGHFPIVEYLISKGAKVGAKDTMGYTALHCACEKGHLKVVKYLISHGADINAAVTLSNWTPLHFATRNGRFEIVQYLISKGAYVGARDIFGQTPFDQTPSYLI